jgi:hypothetical protein
MANFGGFLDAGLFNIGAGLRDQVGIDVEADGARAFFCGGDDDATVAGAEIVNHIAFLDAGKLDHFVDDDLRRRHEGHDLFVFENRVLRASRTAHAAQTEIKGSQCQHKKNSQDEPAMEMFHGFSTSIGIRRIKIRIIANGN